MTESKIIPIEESSITFPYLRKFNLIMGVLHAVQAIIMTILGATAFPDFSRPLTTFYLEGVGPGQGLDGSFFSPETAVAYTFSAVGVWVAGFLGMSAVAHLLIAGPFYNYYVNGLKNYINKIRWIEYAISSSFMIVFISLLFGIWGIWELFLIFMINASMNFFGYSQELVNDKTRMESGNISWASYLFGWWAGIAPWVVSFAYFLQAAGQDPGPPEFVYWILITQLLLFQSFAFNMLLQYLRIGPWRDYLFGERMYQILSLVAKTILAWLVFGGLFQPE